MLDLSNVLGCTCTIFDRTYHAVIIYASYIHVTVEDESFFAFWNTTLLY